VLGWLCSRAGRVMERQPKRVAGSCMKQIGHFKVTRPTNAFRSLSPSASISMLILPNLPLFLPLSFLVFPFSAFLFPSVHAYALPEQQHVLSGEGGGAADGYGVLRRFESKDVDLQGVLQLAQVRLYQYHMGRTE
jgi:hypothetical protein